MELPKEFALFQNFPNPFNPETWIPYQLADVASVEIRIYDVNGKLVRKIEMGKKDAGYYKTKETAAYTELGLLFPILREILRFAQNDSFMSS